MRTNRKRSTRAKARTQRRKAERALKRERACNDMPCVEGCPKVACKVLDEEPTPGAFGPGRIFNPAVFGNE